MEVYLDNFGKWEDAQNEYKMSVPEPDEVIFAHYSYEDYSGSSNVLYRNGRKYYMVSGGHCSCYGLEDQWKPEEFISKKEFVAYLEKINPYESQLQVALPAIIKKLKGKK